MSHATQPTFGATHPALEELLEHRFDPSLPQPEGWDEFVAHLDECSSCRARAVEIDPTLGFRRLPTVEVDASDIAAMVQSVAVLRRNRELTGAQGGIEEARQARSGRWWFPAVAALAVGMGLGMAGGGVPLAPEMSTGGVAGNLSSLRTTTLPGEVRDAASLDAVVDALGASDNFNEPVLEGVENPAARIYQFRGNTSLAEDETIAVAFVIDPTIDV